MKKSFTKLLGALLCALFFVPNVVQATVTATWDWATNNPSGITGLATIQNGTSTITSSNGVILFVDATASGAALRSQSGNAQFNSGTKLRVPVVSTNDVVTFVPNSYGYAGVKIGNDDFDETVVSRTHTATPEEVAQGYVVIESKGGYVNTVSVDLAYTPPTQTIAKWDWKNNVPTSMSSVECNQTSGDPIDVASDITGISMQFISGKLYHNGDNAQFTDGTILHIPVTSISDVVTIYYHPSGFTKVTIGGVDYNTQKTDYIATVTDVNQGFVEVVSGGGYLYSVTLTKGNYTPVTIGTTGWATFSSKVATDFTNAKCAVVPYIVTGNTGSAITKSAVSTTAAANTGLLLNAEEGTYAIPLVATGADLSSTNKLVAVASETTVSQASAGSTNYVLVASGTSAVFQYISSTSATVAAGKAYLTLAVSDPANPARELSLEGDATGIQNIKVGTEDNVYYDLQGRRVLYPKKGLYIVNGKKVILK